ncbi:MAG TPA: hypothetical protein VJ762_13090 [Sphingobium sp.]|nr:hypothetical protein [Sphingobium sp.]
MDGSWRDRPARDENLAAQASPEPRFPTAREKQQIADAQARGKKERAAMRAAGFGDHKGSEGA